MTATLTTSSRSRVSLAARLVQAGFSRGVVQIFSAAICWFFVCVFMQAQTAHFSGAISTIGSGFGRPTSVAMDAAGDVFVADGPNSAVYEIVAVNGTVSANSQVNPVGNGFNYPVGVAVDSHGNVFVADETNGALYEIVAVHGTVSSNSQKNLVGSGFAQPIGVAVDGAGDVFVANSEPGNQAVYEIVAVNGAVSTTSTTNQVGSSFRSPQAVAVDRAGNVFVADYGNAAVYEIVAVNGAVSANSTVTPVGSGFGGPSGVAVDISGNVFVADEGGDAVYKIVAVNGSVSANSTVNKIGSGFDYPAGVAVDGVGDLFVADQNNSAVKEVQLAGLNFGPLPVGTTTPVTLSLSFTFDTSGTIGTPAVLTKGAASLDFTDAKTGTCTTNGSSYTYLPSDSCTVDVTFTPTISGSRHGAAILRSSGGTIATGPVYGIGVGPQAAFPPGLISTVQGGFKGPTGAAVDGAGDVFVADTGKGAVYEVLAVNGAVSASSTVQPVGSNFRQPTGVAVDGAGNVFVTDFGTNTVYEIVAVNGTVSASSAVNTISSGFRGPIGIAVDGSGNVFVGDGGGSVYEIVAVNGTVSSSSSVNAIGSGFGSPYGVAVDGTGNVFVADAGNDAVYEIVAVNGAVSSSSTVNPIGSGYGSPAGVAVDSAGNVFVADFGNGTVEEIIAVNGGVSSNSTVAILDADFSDPYGIAVDAVGNVIIADFGNASIDEVDFATVPSLSFASTAVGATSSDSPQTVTITNNGNAPLTIEAPSAGSNPSVSANFTFGSNSTCPQLSPSTIAPPLASGASCTSLISFTPTVSGAITGSLAITDNASNAAGPNYVTQTIALSGMATAPPPPTVTSISPGTGSIQGGTSVLITGTNFLSGSTVSFGPTAATNVAVVSETSITATAPASSVASTQDVTVTTGNGTSAVNPSDQFTYYLSSAVGTASGTLTATLTITTAGQPSTISVLTQGAAGLDFQFASGGTCSTSTSYTVGQTCTVQYTFTPLYSGQRHGAVQLSTSAGVTIAGVLITGTGLGPQVAFPPGTSSPLGIGFADNAGVAVDSAGDIFVTDTNRGAVYEFVAVNGIVSSSSSVNQIGHGFKDPTGVAVDGAGNVFVADLGNGAVYEIVAVNGLVSTTSPVNVVGSKYSSPVDVAVDGAGNIFVADNLNGAVYEILAVNGAVSSSSAVNSIGSGFREPEGVSVDSVGNVFVADSGNSAVYEIVAVDGVVSSSSTTKPIGSNFENPIGVSVDSAGNVFVADAGNSAVYEIVAVNGAVSSSSTVNPVGGGFGGLQGDLPLDGAGNVFVADVDGIKKVDLADPPLLGFASTAVGATSSDSPQTVTIANNGNAPLTFEAPSAGLNPSVSANFTFGSNSTCPQLSPSTIAPPLASGASCTSLISFTPTVTGAIAGSLAITDNALNATGPNYVTQTVALSGMATAPPPPTVTSISPGAGPVLGGTSVLITGTNFLSASTVSFGPAAATNVAVVSATSITATTPASSAASTQDVTVTTSSGTSATNPSDQFTYYPSLAVGTASSTLTTTLTITTAGQPSTISVLTQGAAGLDFQLASGGTCSTAAAYTVGQTCTVAYTFTPRYPGQRFGAVQLSTSAGLTIASQLVTGSGTGPEVTFSPGTNSTIGSGFKSPQGVAVDSAGNVYVADEANGAVYEIVAVNGVVSSSSTVNTIGSGFNSPTGVAVDGAGNVFVADYNNSAVYEIVAVNGAVSANSTVNTIGGGFRAPFGVAVDGAGNVFVADSNASTVYEIVAVNGTVSASSTVRTINSGFSNLYGVAVDGAGNVFVADYFKGLYEIVAVNGEVSSSSTVTKIASGSANISSVAVDSEGNVFVTNLKSEAVEETVAVNGVVSSTSTVNQVYFPTGNAYGVAVDAAGNVFATESSAGSVVKIDLADAPPQTFASTQVNTTSSDSPQYFYITNNGNAPLTFEVPSAGQNPSISDNFTIDSGSTCPQLSTSSSAATLAAGASCTMLFDFMPTTTGTITGSLAITDNTLNAASPNYATQTLALSGISLPPPPTVTGISPNTGSFLGGTLVTITGTNFYSDSTVYFYPLGLGLGGPAVATNITVVSPTLITANAPAGTGVAVVGVSAGGSSSADALADEFTYTTLPTVTGVSPLNGPIAGGTSVTITGSSFISGASVSFGPTPATNVTVVSGTSITAMAPATSTASIQDITVTTSNGTSAANTSDQFTYYPSLAVATASGTLAAELTITADGQPSVISVLTQGAPGLDFQLVSGGTCSTATSYATGQTCTVEYTFTPRYPGQRYGAVQLTTSTGVTIATQLLTGVGTGPQVTFPPGTVSKLGGGFYKDTGVAVDGFGNIFVADGPHNAVKELVAVNGVVSADSAIITVGSGFNEPSGVAVDGAGDVFVADFSNSAVKEIVAVNGTVSANSTVVTIGSGFIGPIGVAVDGAGNVFVGDTYNNAVYEIVAVNGMVSASSTVNSIGSGFGNPFGVALDSAGDVFVADDTRGVYEIVAVNGAVSSSSTVNMIGSGFNGPDGVAVDSAGNVFVADYHNGAVKEIVASNGAVSANSTVNTVGSGFGFPAGVALDGAGNVFVTALNNITKIDLADVPSLSFASTAVGETSSDSPQTVTLTNNGNAPLILQGLSTGGNTSDSANFTLGSNSTCLQLSSGSSAATLASGASCTSLISFTPTATGPITGSLAITDNALNAASPNYATQTVALSGTATPSLAASTSVASTVLTQDRAATAFTPVVAAGGGGALTYSVYPVLPAGLSFSSSTGAVSGTPTVVSAATTYTVTVTDANAATARATFSLTVKTAVLTPTSTAVSSSTLTTTYGTAVVLTATVTPAPSDTPPGTASFYSGQTMLGSSSLNSTGVATLSTPLLLGPNAITAIYSGSLDYAASTSSVLAVSDRTSSSITLSASPATQLYNNAIVLTAQASSTTPGTLTGTVTFLDGETMIATASLGANGQATYSSTTLTDGSHTLSALYSGDPSFQPSGSTGAAVAITIADVSLQTPSTQSAPVLPGASVAYDLQLSPVSTPKFLYDVHLSATGLPPGATYSFSPAMVAAGSAGGPITLTVQTARGNASLRMPQSPGRRNSVRGLTALAFGLLLPLLGAKRVRKRLKRLPRPLTIFLFTVLSLGAAAGVAGCGGGGFFGPTATTGKYTITVTATSADLVRVSTVQLTIQ